MLCFLSMLSLLFIYSYDFQDGNSPLFEEIPYSLEVCRAGLDRCITIESPDFLSKTDEHFEICVQFNFLKPPKPKPYSKPQGKSTNKNDDSNRHR